jgi:hypothetical protein
MWLNEWDAVNEVFIESEYYFYNAILSFIIGIVGMFLLSWINQKIGESKTKKEAQEKEAADKKAQAASTKAAKKESEAAKKASEERKKELIKKYGEEDGMLIFKRKISEKNYKKKKELIKKYGEKFGLAVFDKGVHKGMSLAMVEDAIGKHKYKEGNDHYFGKPFERKIVIVKDKVIEDGPVRDGIWMDMPVKMLIASWGRPGDKKESVTKSSVKERLLFNGRENRQGGTSYEYQVDVENDLVVGWKELE